jgi:hypothetical protein
MVRQWDCGIFVFERLLGDALWNKGGLGTRSVARARLQRWHGGIQISDIVSISAGDAFARCHMHAADMGEKQQILDQRI